MHVGDEENPVWISGNLFCGWLFFAKMDIRIFSIPYAFLGCCHIQELASTSYPFETGWAFVTALILAYCRSDTCGFWGSVIRSDATFACFSLWDAYPGIPATMLWGSPGHMRKTRSPWPSVSAEFPASVQYLLTNHVSEPSWKCIPRWKSRSFLLLNLLKSSILSTLVSQTISKNKIAYKWSWTQPPFAFCIIPRIFLLVFFFFSSYQTAHLW